jgi:uncharacterized membrane protein (DUF106 family)
MELIQQSQTEIIKSVMESAQPFIAGSVIITGVIIVFYIINSVMKWRSQKAILDIRKTLKEMNERQKESGSNNNRAEINEKQRIVNEEIKQL